MRTSYAKQALAGSRRESEVAIAQEEKSRQSRRAIEQRKTRAQRREEKKMPSSQLPLLPMEWIGEILKHEPKAFLGVSKALHEKATRTIWRECPEGNRPQYS